MRLWQRGSFIEYRGGRVTGTDPRPSKLRRFAQNSALGAVVMVLLFAVLEVVARLGGYEPLFDVYSKPSLFWRHDPLLGWSHEPGVSGTFVGPRPWPVEFRSPIEINSAGLRGPEIPEPVEGGLRILILGDSLVAGFEVAHEDTYAAIMGERLSRKLGRPVQVINAGVRGYGTDQSLLFFREHGKALAPDLVVYALSVNDPADNITLHRMRRPFGKAAFRPTDDGGLDLVGHPIPEYALCSAWALDADFEPIRLDGPSSRAACWLQTRLADHSALFSFITLRARRSPALIRLFYKLGSPEQSANAVSPDSPQISSLLPLGPIFLSLVRHGLVATDDPTPPASHAWALTSSLIREMDREADKIGARFILLINHDSWNALDGELLVSEGIIPHNVSIVSGEAASRGVRFRNDAHLNETGHDLFARGLADLLVETLEGNESSQPDSPE